MSNEIFSFKWPIARPTGYCFKGNLKMHDDAKSLNYPLKGRYHSGPFLVEAQGNTVSFNSLPLKYEPELFVKFAKLDTSKESIIKFANLHGRLGLVNPLMEQGGSANMLTMGESLNDWRQQIIDIKFPVLLWGLLKESKEEELRKYIMWGKDNSSVSYSYEQNDTKISPRAKNKIPSGIISSATDNIFGTFISGDVTKPAQYYLLNTINEKLKGNASPSLIFNSTGDLDPYITPHNLLAAIWLQLFRAVSGQRDFRRCKICKNWMDISQFKRSDKKRHDICYERRKKKRQEEKKQEEKKQEEKRKLKAKSASKR